MGPKGRLNIDKSDIQQSNQIIGRIKVLSVKLLFGVILPIKLKRASERIFQKKGEKIKYYRDRIINPFLLYQNDNKY